MADSLHFQTLDEPDMDSDEDLDLLNHAAPAATTSELRREQKAIADAWCTSDAGQQALLPKAKAAKATDAADEELSMDALMAKRGTEIIKNPREYQLELFERAKKQNTIAVLDTGSGKTLIAVLLLRWIIDQELERREAGDLPKISFFLCQAVTLVHQQYCVLETNLDHAVEKVVGSDNADNWSKAKWTKLFSENKVIVCTAEILCQCLAHSYITMKQINLLIFDEAHHAKKNHAYARIIKDYYLEEPDDSSRPRIFGMTASPIDAKTDVSQAANDLETILHSHIATTQDTSLTDAVNKPTEMVMRYATLPLRPYETPLLQAVVAKFGDIAVFKRIFDLTPRIARELGPWCADQYIIGSIAEKRLRQYELKVERKFHQRAGQNGVKDLDTVQAQLKSAVDLVQVRRSEVEVARIADADLSSKVRELREYLKATFERPTSHRCIVFVEQRHTARLLSALFQRIGTQFIKPAFLVGGNSPEIEEDNFSYRQQVLTIHKFADGEINCLFATSVAEEGLDVPDCNLVIRFDPYRTMIQYVQSRGRARQKNSKFIHMLEIGNHLQSQLVTEVRYHETRMRAFCGSLPEDRKLVGNEDILEDLLAKEKDFPIYVDSKTGAKLTYGNALGCLANFVSALPEDTGEPLHPTYVVSSRGSKFIAEVLLPAGAPFRSVMGRPWPKKALAKRAAAFDACLQLRKGKNLDEHLMPTVEKKRRLMVNALLALNMKKTNQYSMKTKPSLWEETRGNLPTELWATIIDFESGLERPHQPLALLTRTRTPKFPSFPIFLNDLRESKVVPRPLDRSLQIDDTVLSKLSEFTFRIFKDVFSKKYEQDASKLSYWLAPVAATPLTSSIAPDQALDWNLINEVVRNDEYQWTPDTESDTLVNKFLIDRWDGGRKFYSIAIDSGLHPQDPVPEGTARAKWESSIIDYTVSLWKKAREKAVWNPDQPVIEAEKIAFRRNMLATPSSQEVNVRRKAFLCPEPLRISALPPAVVASCFVWPAVIHRLESYLIANEACSMVGVNCSLDVALAALTKDSENSEEHDTDTRVNFQKGMGENYERLEFIGDTFLKTATTISTFIQNPKDDECDFHVKRMNLLCNKNLFRVALELGLPDFVRSIAFSRRLWYPEGLKLLEGKGVNRDADTAVIKHGLGDKTIADVCEAMIGAAFVSHDRPGEPWKEDHFEDAVRAVTKLVSHKDHAMNAWNDYRLAYEIPPYQTGDVTASQRDLAAKVALEHAYHFNYPRLLRSAFIHPSQPRMFENLPNYQRLEFLGDALLDMASITHLFYRFPGKDPQWLTEHKMAMVSNKFLGSVCVNIGFYKHMRYTSPIIEHQIRQYANELLEAKRVAGDSRDYWTTVSDPPKCLPDIVESYVGAMFVDSNFDYNVVQDFFDKNIQWYFEDMSLYDTYANNHPCTRLYRLLGETFGCQGATLIPKELPPTDLVGAERRTIVMMVLVHREVVAHAVGTSSKYASVRAAKDAIEVLEGLAPFEYRTKFGCDCRPKDASIVVNGIHGSASLPLVTDEEGRVI